MERTAAPAKNELVISRDCKQFNVAWSADLNIGCMGDLVGGGTGGPNQTGMPLTDLDYVLWGNHLMDSSSQILATCFTCLLWLGHIFSPSEQGTVITGPSKGEFKARAGRGRRHA